MSESIKERMPKIPDLLTSRELTPLLQAMQADIAALSASLNQLLIDYDAATVPTTATAVTPNITA